MLFELIAHRYERRSLLITANQPFSNWHTIFADDRMTVAAVDHLVHHALIVEMHANSGSDLQVVMSLKPLPAEHYSHV